ncbi:uncharacterized protein LOC110095932 [Dendrobium catenatum]|uniref:uncharacterized protein LOC110095932 n=1 Tax=Dendrobium catenatum TaxID=906689 RepID=UPI0009F23C64|nr:uncharacterized protein LOC110095932 [Dendrobium catenatum]
MQHPTHVCLLRKSIYGLKQAPRQWFQTFSQALLNIGFQKSNVDPSLFTYHHNNNQAYLLIYVDDILLTNNHPTSLLHIIASLSKKFSIKHLGKPSRFLGINILHHSNSMHLSQTPYAEAIIQQEGILKCKPISNPSYTKAPVSLLTDSTLSDPTVYRQLTGSLQYLTITQPDISFAVNQLCQHLHNPLPQHFLQLKRLLRYICGTLNFGIPISKSSLHLQTFSDADWSSDSTTRRSISSYCSFLGQTLISWTVKKQQSVARSSTEAKYCALASATADVIWLRRLLSDFHIIQDKLTNIHCDSMSAIALANNSVFHARTKHIEVDVHFTRDHIQAQVIRIVPISTQDQIADVLTKPLSTPRFHLFRSKLTVQPSPSVCEGLKEQLNKHKASTNTI